jgi:hypothetical protein
LRIGPGRRGEEEYYYRRPKRRCTPRRVDHLNKSLLFMLKSLQLK